MNHVKDKLRGLSERRKTVSWRDANPVDLLVWWAFDFLAGAAGAISMILIARFLFSAALY